MQLDKHRKNSITFIIEVIFTLMVILLASCNENDPVVPVESEDFDFELLMIENDTILKGETTTVEAIASGGELTYNWSASVGDILGSGSNVIYGASPCALGDILIKCEVKDENNNSEEKTVKLFIKQ